jgi:minor extracellular serine protease Vpr
MIIHSNFLVGIIDTGIDYTHPAFGSCTKIGSEGCTVQFGYDFVGDSYNGAGTPQPDDDPMDECVGHGTHVAGILAGKDVNVVGVAPNVQLGIYRVFGCTGGTTPDLLIAAMKRAYADGMDIISMSLGGDAGFTDSPESMVVEELTKKGVIFSIAVGNSGKEGVWMAANPSVASSATAVTSFDSSQGVRRTFTIKNGKEIIYGTF